MKTLAKPKRERAFAHNFEAGVLCRQHQVKPLQRMGKCQLITAASTLTAESEHTMMMTQACTQTLKNVCGVQQILLFTTHFILQLKLAVPSSLPQCTCKKCRSMQTRHNRSLPPGQLRIAATSHIRFFFVVHPLELGGHKDVR